MVTPLTMRGDAPAWTRAPMKPFRIFRPGKHVASCGTAVEFTEDDLKRAVEAYDPAKYSAPLVIGHPKTEDRAYGWAERLTYEDGHVVAHPDKVAPEFADLVAQGAYRNRSASWYMPDHPNNPVPGVLYPKHIGFLGAVPPALKGLGDVAFGEEPRPDLVLEFAGIDEAGWSIANAVDAVARLMRSLRDNLIAEKGVEAADKQLPDYAISDAADAARRLREQASQAAGASPAFSETPNEESPMTPEQIAQLQRDHEAAQARLAQFQERETAIAAAERLALVDGIRRSLQPHVQAGRLLPAQVGPLAEFMANLPAGEADATIEFGEAVEGVTPKVTPRAFLEGFLASLPKQVHFGEHGAETLGNGGAISPRELAKKAGDLVDAERAAGRHLSFTEATNRVLAELNVSAQDPATTPNV